MRQAGYTIERGIFASRLGVTQDELSRFNVRRAYGIDIKPAAVVVLVADLNGKIVAEERRGICTIGQLHPRPLLSLVRTTAKAALVRARVPPSDLKAAGIGVPGRVDPRSGRISLVPTLPNWDGLIIGKRLARSLDCPVVLENDMHLAMLAERGFGSADARDTVHTLVLVVRGFSLEASCIEVPRAAGK